MSTNTITSREELLALIAEHDAREAIAFAATGPVEQATAVSAKSLIADAPALPALNARSITGQTIKALIAAGERAAIVQTRRGVRVERDLTAIADDPDVIVLVEHYEAVIAVGARGEREVDFARDVLARELDAYDYATAA